MSPFSGPKSQIGLNQTAIRVWSCLCEALLRRIETRILDLHGRRRLHWFPADSPVRPQRSILRRPPANPVGIGFVKSHRHRPPAAASDLRSFL
ncbi:hypothetical protein MUK42_35627 [Musa troglodytarum]|uniref:Uncharacterized protein n=1 Tax=Musa troglodytarum TaxID=320322 RepID=A0A9E7EGT2_9LILI|nr:hypothetical protein MUK42_35627 [Musa troglodytarum]